MINTQTFTIAAALSIGITLPVLAEQVHGHVAGVKAGPTCTSFTVRNDNRLFAVPSAKTVQAISVVIAWATNHEISFDVDAPPTLITCAIDGVARQAISVRDVTLGDFDFQ